MTHRGCLILGIVLALPAAAQTTRQTLASILGFENGTAGQYPAGWGGTQNGTIFIDNQVVHSGRNSARIERTANSPQEYSTLTTGIPLDFAGKTIEWRGFLRTENVNGYAALWLREDGNSPNLAFSTLQDLNLNGTRGWTQYSISVPVLQQGTQLWFGFLLTGTGKAWVDDLQLLVDGVPVGNLTTPFDTDHEFDAGSRIAITSLSSTQIRNLATLAKVWGFLKYHHPAITVGTRHWDYDLFRVLPQVLAAADSAGANLAMSTWIANLGPIDNCTTCTSLDSSDLHLTTNLDWIGDETLLGSDLSQTLRSAYRNRRSANRQFFVSLAPSVFNPSFDNEPTYPALRLPDSGYQLLALFRFWNMVQYFYPNRNIMSDDATATDYWSGVLEEFIPAIGLAPDSLNYQQQMLRFIAKINDTHANLWSSLAARPPRGSCQLPVDVRFVEGHALVLRLTSSTAGPAGGLMPGDVIDRLDGRAVTDLVGEWWQFYADSNDAARWRDIAQYITHGACGPADVAVRRGRSVLSLRPSRVAGGTLDTTRANVHDLPGNTFQMLASDVAYLCDAANRYFRERVELFDVIRTVAGANLVAGSGSQRALGNGAVMFDARRRKAAPRRRGPGRVPRSRRPWGCRPCREGGV